MSDLLDVLHVLFEDAQDASSQEQMQARERFRRGIYEGLYGYPKYEWVSPDSDTSSGMSSQGAGTDMMPMDDEVADPSKIKLTHKPYSPPTPMNVDSPLPIKTLKEAPLG